MTAPLPLDDQLCFAVYGAMQALIGDVFIKAFDNPLLRTGEDQARLPLAEAETQGLPSGLLFVCAAQSSATVRLFL